MIENNKLKVYIASSSRFIPKMKQLAENIQKEMLEAGGLGIEITRTWWKYHHEDDGMFGKMSDMMYYSHPQVQFIRELDKKAIRDADVMIIYNEDSYKLGGAVWEMGYADGVGTPVMILGRMKRSTMYSGSFFAQNEKELIEALKRWIN